MSHISLLANEHLKMNPYSPPNRGRIKKKKLEIRRGDYCQDQDVYRGINQTRVFPMHVGRLAYMIFLFFLLHFSPGCIFRVQPYTFSFIGWSQSKFAIGGFITVFTLLNLIPIPSLILSVFLSSRYISTCCYYQNQTNSEAPWLLPYSCETLQNN